MRKGLSAFALVLAAPCLGWAVLFCLLAGVKAWIDGPGLMLEQLRFPYVARAVMAAVLGSALLLFGIMLRTPVDGDED